MPNRSPIATNTEEREPSSTTPLLKRGQSDIESRNSDAGYQSTHHVVDEWEAEGKILLGNNICSVDRLARSPISCLIGTLSKDKGAPAPY